jgi:hypothetical protein
MSRLKPTIAILAAAVAFAPAAQATAAPRHANTRHVAKKAKTPARAHASGARCTGRRSDC